MIGPLRHPLRHLGFEGPRHDGRYGFGGRRTRYALFVDDGTGPAFVVDPNTWARVRDRIHAEPSLALWDASTAPLTDRFRP